jgi:hypothetical protein
VTWYWAAYHLEARAAKSRALRVFGAINLPNRESIWNIDFHLYIPLPSQHIGLVLPPGTFYLET